MRKCKWVICVICFLGVICFMDKHYSADLRSGINNFPDSYQPYLLELQKKYPNWNFTALYTNLEWSYVIGRENKFGMNLVPKSYSNNWKNTTVGQYNIEVDAGWVDSSRRALEYAMDPRNFLNYIRIFQFEGLSYDEKTNNLDGIEKILYGTEFYNRIVQYVNSYGSTITTQNKYSNLILNAAKISGVSAYHLASRIKQEVGPFLSHSSISGTVSGYRGLYNFYNIGATSSTEYMGAIKNGLQYAKDGKGASLATRSRYLIPWDTKEKAITGGAIFIGASYINRGQDTVYLQKFHVNDNTSSELFWHQYMTNVLAPYSESRSIYNGYLNTGILDGPMSFIIPVYNHMPEIPVQNPNILESDFTADNTKVYADVTTTLNVRSGPSTSYESIINVDRSVTMTRIKRGIQSGELWDMVKLDNGIIGYVFHTYLKEVPIIVYPILSENEVIFDSDLKVENRVISGLDISNLTVSNIKNKIHTLYNIEMYDYNGNRLSDNSLVGTGARIRFLDVNGAIKSEYQVLIYGDTNGDGKINSIDLLVLQRHILEISTMDNIFIKAANVRKNGKAPNSLDSLLIQRHILRFQSIEQ